MVAPDDRMSDIRRSRISVDRVADAGNAWGPDVSPSGFQNARRIRPMLTSVGAEVTTEVLGLYNVELRLRTGVAVPLREGRGARVYLRVGLPF